jgi:hypothetical protein
MMTNTDERRPYHQYSPGDVLPEGLYPPLEGYTHQALIDEAAAAASAYLRAKNIDPQLVRETAVAMAAAINAVFEEEYAEYQIAKVAQDLHDQPEQRQAAIEKAAEHFGATAYEAAAQSLRGSPLLHRDNHFLKELVAAAGRTIQARIQHLA